MKLVLVGVDPVPWTRPLHSVEVFTELGQLQAVQRRYTLRNHSCLG